MAIKLISIRIGEENKQALDNLKLIPSETYNNVIRRLIEKAQ